MKILFLSRWFPYPPDNGSKIRIFNLLAGLSSKHQITLISHYEPSEGEPQLSELMQYCGEIQTVPWKAFHPDSLQARIGFFSLQPRSFIDTFSVELMRKIEAAIAREHYDLVIASQIDMAAYAPYFHSIPAIFEEAEVGVLYEQYASEQSMIRRMRHALTWAKYRRFLKGTIQMYRICTVVSNREAELLSQAVGNEVEAVVIPNCIDLHAYDDIRETPQPQTLIFTGAFTFDPNYEAMLWFLNEVYDTVIDQAPSVHLTITGNHANRPLPRTDHLSLAGFVPDIRPLVARSWCSVVPIHTGGGTRLKILEAMALGTPVVTTSKGMEGLDLCPGENVLVADAPAAFAEAILALFKDAALRQRLALNAQRLIKEKYNWAVVMPRFLDIVEQIS